MKGLFVNAPLWGHISPSIPIAEGLEAAGHEITFVVPDRYSKRVESCSFRPYTYSSDLQNIEKVIESGTLILELIQDSYKYVGDIQQLILNSRYDYAVVGTVCSWASLLVLSENIPLVNIHPTCISPPNSSLAPPDDMLDTFTNRERFYFRRINKAVEGLCNIISSSKFLDRRLVQLYPGDLVLVTVPAWFDENSHDAPDRFHYIGPLIDDAVTRSTKRDRKKHILISLGTVYSGESALYKFLLEVVSKLNMRVTVAAGRSFNDLKNFGSDKVTVHEFIDIQSLLTEVDVFINHGGMNSVMESLSFGVPIICVPQMKEQRANASRIVELGFGFLFDHLNRDENELISLINKCLESTLVTKVQEAKSLLPGYGGLSEAMALIGDTATNAPHTK